MVRVPFEAHLYAIAIIAMTACCAGAQDRRQEKQGMDECPAPLRAFDPPQPEDVREAQREVIIISIITLVGLAILFFGIWRYHVSSIPWSKRKGSDRGGAKNGGVNTWGDGSSGGGDDKHGPKADGRYHI